MSEEPTLCGFVARVRAKEDMEGLSFRERKYSEAMGRVAKRK